MSSFGRSPTPSLRPFDRRFHAQLSSSPLNSPRASSPAFLNVHSRHSSTACRFTLVQDLSDTDSPQAPWEVVRWIRLRKITGQAFSEIGRRNFGRPTCIAVAASIALGTSKGIILVFDYSQNLKSIIGPGTKGIVRVSDTTKEMLLILEVSRRIWICHVYQHIGRLFDHCRWTCFWKYFYMGRIKTSKALFAHSTSGQTADTKC